jgi:hypothetical protein
MIRDTRERGYSSSAVAHRLRTLVMPLHDRYVEPQRKWADVILSQPFREKEILQLADRLWAIVERAALLPSGMRVAFLTQVSLLLIRPGATPDEEKTNAIASPR